MRVDLLFRYIVVVRPLHILNGYEHAQSTIFRGFDVPEKHRR